MFEHTKGFVIKFANDWVTNLAAMLAYNLLMSIFPIIFALLSIVGLIAPQSSQQRLLIDQVLGVLPPGTRQSIDLARMLQGTHQNAGWLFIISLIGFLWIGGNLFGTMENAFGIIYRIKGRHIIRQKLMCLGMIFVFALLVPIMILASSLLGLVLGLASRPIDPLMRLLPSVLYHPALILVLAGPVGGFIAAFILFFTIYLIVPNTEINPHLAWRGALVAAALLDLANLIFPYYTSRFINTAEYGDTISFAIILMIWFWVFGIILLLGAEINSYMLGQRALPTDIAGCLHDIQVHERNVDELPFHRRRQLREHIKRAQHHQHRS